MVTIKEYCKTLGGEINPIMDVLTVIEQQIQATTEPVPDNLIIVTPGTVTERLEERKLLSRAELRKDAFLHEQLRVGVNSLKYLSDFKYNLKKKLDEVTNNLPISLQQTVDSINHNVQNNLNYTLESVDSIDNTIKSIISKI